ncbi:MAG: plastocyanin/azurin family copper-binding protein [Acidimicrobiales bacterium]
MHLPIRRLLPVLSLALVLVACGDHETADDDDTTTSAAAAESSADDASTTTAAPSAEAAPADDAVATDQVTVVGFAFEPASIAVDAGTTVVWTNEDETLHTVTPTDEPTAFGGSLDAAGAVVESSFDEAGTFEYFCSIHPSMTGVVTVSG